MARNLGRCVGNFLATFALALTASAYADTVVITENGVAATQYYDPGEWNNPGASNYPRLTFDLPGSLLGATVNSATLTFTGRPYGGAPTAAVELILTPGPNQTVASGIVYPFNFGQYATVDVASAVSSWVGTGAARVRNQGLLMRLDSGFADLPNGTSSTESYRPKLTIDYTATIASTKAGQILAGSSALGQNWSFEDVATLQNLYLAGGGQASVDGETWYYTATEYSTSGTWGGAHAIGDAWVDGQGFKHIYLGSGLTTAPVPEPATYAQLLAGLLLLAMFLRQRRSACNLEKTQPAKLIQRSGVVAAIALLAATSGAALAQGYPNKPIRFVVPYPAGGGTDIIGRMIATKLGEAWGQQVVVENRVGASGIVGNDLVAKAAPDGYTVLIGITTLVQMPHLNSKLPYEVFRDFTPIAQLALSSNLFAVPAASPAGNLKDFIALARSEPTKFGGYGTYGAGTSSHLHGELFNLQTGLKLTHVPYKGGAPLATDLMGGQVPSGLIDLASARAHIAGGRMKFLAISGSRRYAALPDVPTFAEQGLKDFEASGWFAMFLPANAPREVSAKLAGEVSRILRLPDVAARINDIGLQPADSTLDAFAAVMRRDYEVWGRIVREAQIRLEQ